MKKVNYQNSTSKLMSFCLLIMLAFSTSVSAQGDPVNGKKLFNANCAACHKLDKRAVGPALGGVAERRKKEWLHSWIKDSQKLIASGDADAKAIFDEYKIPMMAYPQFSDAELDDILAYTTPSVAKKSEAAPAAQASEGSSSSVAGDPAKGKALFNTNCAACHKLDKKATGPALRGITERRETEWLYKWIANSKSLIDSGDADAKAIFDEYKIPMTAFPQLSKADVDNILAYTAQSKAEKKAVVAPAGGTKTGKGESNGLNSNAILGVLVLVLAILAAMLFLVNKTLKTIADKNGIETEECTPLWKAFAKNQFLVLVSVILFALFAAYHAFGFLMQVGVDKGYQPVQPIHFSHRIHAGDNGIDCKYCHSNARVSKTSGIPALNVCMNCHKGISEVAESTATADHDKAFYDGEIQKLYDAVGWNGFKYEGEAKPVKWVRVHNLPDFAYYNHSQHVSVAGLQCQECHGEVEKMEILEQHAPLTMGWCINCHREKEVNMKDNGYYTKIHEQLKKKYGVDKFTVAQMGGMECGKCHY